MRKPYRPLTRRQDDMLLLFAVVSCVAAVVLTWWIFHRCRVSCEEQYGTEWNYRITSEWGTCDCVGPGGEVRVPR